MFRRSRRGLAALGTAAALVVGIVTIAPPASSLGLTFTWTGTAAELDERSGQLEPAWPSDRG